MNHMTNEPKISRVPKGRLLFVISVGMAILSPSCSSPTPPLPPSGTDTTNHDFVWQIDTLGETSSVLYDVAIINDSTAWAVGEIYLRDDSTRQIDPLPYNAVRLHGREWTPVRIEFPQFNFDCSVAFSSAAIVNAIFSVSATSTLFTDGLAVVKWDGSSFHNYPCLSLSLAQSARITKIWGESEYDLYCVGTEGMILHYVSGQWTRIPSGTTTRINDAYGIRNKRTGRHELFCAVTDFFSPRDRTILRIHDFDQVDSVAWAPGKDVTSIWSVDGSYLYASGSSVFENSSGTWREKRLGAYTNRIRGSDWNNVFVVGDFGLVSHFNGSTWHSFFPAVLVNYNSLAVTNSRVIAVGSDGVRAFIVAGRRP